MKAATSVWAFDLDGTLLDTHALIARSYRRAGAPVVSGHVMRTQTWTEWLVPMVGTEPARTIWERKNELYLEGLPHVAELPLLDEVRRTEFRCAVLLTGAPRGTLQVVRERFGTSWPFVLALEEMTRSMKYSFLTSVSKRGVYVDDQHFDVPPGWRFIRV